MLTFLMRYVQIDANGRYRYRRGIPEKYRKLLGRREFLKVLGTTEAEAIRQYQAVHDHFDRKLKALASLKTEGPDRQSYMETAAHLQALGASTHKPTSEDEEAGRGLIADTILEEFQQDEEGDYIDLPERQRQLVQALYQGLDAQSLTLGEGFEFYLKEKAKPDETDRQRQLTRYGRALRTLDQCLGQHRPIASLTRQDARGVRDYLLSTGVEVTTVQRYLKDIRAVLNFAIREHDIACRNPFAHLDLPARETPVSEERLSLPPEIIRAIEDDLCGRKDQTLFHLFTLLRLTGARLSEITGLLIEEVHLDADIPFVDIKPRSGRSLKNEWSKRIIPLTPKAHAVANLAVEGAGSSPYLFEKFAVGRGSDNASARLLKAIRKQTSDRKHTAHSLRHNFRDRIRQVKTIPLELGNALEGRKYSMGEEARYGGGYSLETLYKALLLINGEA